jgi:pimeloyl-ACP methyl ester carboxylesterase
MRLRVLVASGIYSDCFSHVSNVFSYALTNLEKYGYRTADLRMSGRSSSTHNALHIRNALANIELLPDEKVVLVGYSKGAPDILEAIAAYPEIRQKIAPVISVAGAVGGSLLADMSDKPYQELLERLPFPHCPPGVGDPVESLKRSTRQAWLSRNRLPESIKYFSLVAFGDRNDISVTLKSTYDLLALIDQRNDSQLLFYDQIIPGCTLLGYAKADHWAVAMPFSQDIRQLASVLVDKNQFPREILLEAIIRFVEEKLLISN